MTNKECKCKEKDSPDFIPPLLLFALTQNPQGYSVPPIVINVNIEDKNEKRTETLVG